MKRLIVCSDGTFGTPQIAYVTNVVKMTRAIAPIGPATPPASGTATQLVFYDPGVGTEGSLWRRALGGVSGLGLSKNIRECYEFLVQNYEAGDEIFILGFSRGAYTARSLAGFLRNSGLLKPEHAGRLGEAFDLYRSDSHPDSPEAITFREDYSQEQEVTVRFLGVWDTVGSLGIPPLGRFSFFQPVADRLNRPFQFHDVELSGSVKNAYHALAIDERRASFPLAIWKPKEVGGVVVSRAPKPGQVIEQVWFAGYHNSLGGGELDSGLSDITFTWMMEKAKACDLAFNSAFVSATIRPNELGRARDSRTTFWRLAGTFIRNLGTTWHETEHVHQVVLNRQRLAAYDPNNLVRYQNGPNYQIMPPPP